MSDPAHSGAPRRRVPIRLLVRLAVIAVTLALCALLLRGLKLHEVIATLRHADWRLVLAAVAANMSINTVARVSRWRTLVTPLPHTGEAARWWELCSILLASGAASNLLPARAGEALRTVQLHRRHGYPVGGLVAAQLIEKVIEGLSLGSMAIPVALWGETPIALRVPLFLFAAVGAVGIVTLLVLPRRAGPCDRPNPPTKPSLPSVTPPVTPPVTPLVVGGGRARFRRLLLALSRFFGRLGEGLQLMRAPFVLSTALAWSWLSDLADALMVGLCMHSVGIELPIGSWVSMLLAINVAIALPSTPAQLGVLEAGAVLALATFGVPESQALAFAVLYHAAHVIPTTLAGLVGLRQQWVPANQRA